MKLTNKAASYPQNIVICHKAVKLFNHTCFSALTHILLMWRIWWAPNNASRWQVGFNSAFKELTSVCKLCTVNQRMTPKQIARMCQSSLIYVSLWECRRSEIEINADTSVLDLLYIYFIIRYQLLTHEEAICYQYVGIKLRRLLMKIIV